MRKSSTDMLGGNGTKENLHLGTKISVGTSKIHILTRVIYVPMSNAFQSCQ